MRARLVPVLETDDDLLLVILARRELGYGGPTADQYGALERIHAGYMEAAETEHEREDE